MPFSEVLSQEDAPTPELLSLTLNALYALGKLGREQLLVKAAFELRAACQAGFSPDLEGCRTCGNPQPDRFVLTDGCLECTGCRGGEEIRLPVSAGALAAMRHITGCLPGKLFSFRLAADSLKELSGITESYLSTQLERSFSTLDFYKSLFLLSSP